RIDKPPVKKSAPLTSTQLKEKREKRETRQAEIDAAVDDWRMYTNEKASELAERFDLKPRYFLDVFFQGGAKMVNHQEKVNPYNHSRVRRPRRIESVSGIQTVPELHADHIDEYNSLTDVEKDALVERFR
ncbi:hypothetical protein B0H10DRAFT_1732128, partial [Mycena sp. CBHHK59/15]